MTATSGNYSATFNANGTFSGSVSLPHGPTISVSNGGLSTTFTQSGHVGSTKFEINVTTTLNPGSWPPPEFTPGEYSTTVAIATAPVWSVIGSAIGNGLKDLWTFCEDDIEVCEAPAGV